MGLVAVAIIAGVLAGIVAGGRPGRATAPALRWVPALVVGALAQWLPEVVALPDLAGFVAVSCSYAALLAFAAVNLRIAGMPVVALGIALNVFVIVPNEGMPVRGDAIVRAGIADPAELDRIDLGAKRHLEADGDVLAAFGDVVPIRPLREVVSVGDLVLAAGVALVAYRLLRPRPGDRRPPNRPTPTPERRSPGRTWATRTGTG